MRVFCSKLTCIGGLRHRLLYVCRFTCVHSQRRGTQGPRMVGWGVGLCQVS